jgi:ubiquinol oxidase
MLWLCALASAAALVQQPVMQRPGARPSVARPVRPEPHPPAAVVVGEQVLGPGALMFDKLLVHSVKGVIDVLYRRRDIQRFYVLETIARCPYFAYSSGLHLAETLGRRDGAELKAKHFAQSENELQHLLIMEALGGADHFIDRFVAQHVAFFYFWFVVLVYLARPQQAYHLSELIEEHAYLIYDNYIRDNKAWLESQPAPQVAIEYYGRRDAPSSRAVEESAPWELRSLLDTFVSIRDDEAEHWEGLVCLASTPTSDMADCIAAEGGSA